MLAPLLLCSCLCAAQDSGSSAAPPPAKPPKIAPAPAAEAAPARVEEASPPLYYLKDKNGNLQAVPGFSFEDFEELFKLQNQLAQQEPRPRYSLQHMSIAGVVNADHAELTVRFHILLREERWVRIPLRFDRALLSEPAQYKGLGEQFLHFESDGEGYVSWIRGPAGDQREPKPNQPGQLHELTLKMVVPLTVAGDETRLKLVVPRATSSELKLKVPLDDAAGSVSEGATLLPPVAGKGTTEFTVLGLGGDFELTWRKPGRPVASVPAVLEASGTVLARVDNRSVESEANLSVRGYGAAFDQFRVRLPEGAELVPGNPSGYTVTPVSDGDSTLPQQRLVEVRLAKKTSGPVEIRLNTRRPHDTTAADQWCELAGFEVVGAARQWGTLAVAVSGDWQILWGPSRAVRQIDQIPQALRHQDLVAGFEYFAQPCSLSARLVPKKTRVSVEPEYLLLVERDQVRLDAKLKYTVRGAKVFALEVVLPGWELDGAGPENLVAVDGVGFTSPDVLSLPLVQPSTGQIEIRIRAHRPVAAGAKSILLPLPQPRANALGAASVAVVAADNVELTPQSEATVGLIREQVAPATALPERQQEPLFYRVEAANAVFAADFSIHTQSVAVEVNSRLSLDEQAAQVEQKLSYSIAYEPLDALTVDVPRSLAGSDRLEFQYGGKPIAATPLPKKDADDGNGPVRTRITLPAGRIGSCELLVRYPVALPKLNADKPVAISVPLVMPAAGTLSGNKLLVAAAPGIVVERREGRWSTAEKTSPPLPRRELQLTVAERTGQVDLTVAAEQADDPKATVVDRAWLQTELTYSARHDRAAFRFTSDRKEIDVLLPAGALASQMYALIDGKRVTGQMAGPQRLLIPLSGDTASHEHLLQLDYGFADGRPRRGQMSLELPRLGSDMWTRRMYWQIVLPPDEHLIAAPAGFTSEFAWEWSGYYWGRKPLLEQAELETWIGAPHDTAVSDRTNRYLFSTLGQVERGELRTAGRSWIVLLASGASLVAGLLLIYVPLSRRPASLFGVVVVLLCVALIYPEPTVLLAQAAGLGLVLALLAGLLERGVARRRRIAVVAEGSSARVEIGSTRSHRLPPTPGSQKSTQAAPALAPPSPGESHT